MTTVHPTRRDGRRIARRRGVAARMAALVIAAVPMRLDAQVRPVVEVYVTATDNTIGRAGDATFARLGEVRPSPALGLGAGLMFGGLDVIAFGETGAVPVRGAGGGAGTLDLTRNAFGVRLERPLARLPRGFSALGAVSGLWQEYEPVRVRGPVDRVTPLELPARDDPNTVRLDAQAWGGRLELGIEHRGFLGSAWMLLAGVTALRDVGGNARDFTTTAAGWRAVPSVTLAVRSRGW